MADIADELRAWAPLIASGYECPAASTAMHRAADALDAKDKRIAELSGGWQPIETAPKDGQEFIACLPRQGGVRVLVRWDKVHACWLSKGSAISLFEGDLWYPLPAPPSRSLLNKEEENG